MKSKVDAIRISGIVVLGMAVMLCTDYASHPEKFGDRWTRSLAAISTLSVLLVLLGMRSARSRLLSCFIVGAILSVAHLCASFSNRTTDVAIGFEIIILSVCTMQLITNLTARDDEYKRRG